MKLMDYHCHNQRCGHALGEIEEYVKVAMEKNLREIGITDHFPLGAVIDDPQYNDIIKRASMAVKEFSNYIAEIKRLKDKYCDEIKVRVSTEINFETPGALNRQKKILKPYMDDFDYILGAIHNIKWHDSPVITIFPQKDFETLKTYGMEKLNSEYVNKLQKLVETDFFDVIGHFDNQRVLFGPNQPVYSENTWQELLRLLNKIKTKGMAIEINTSGILKGIKNQFPDDPIIKEAIQRDIPLYLGSDAHSPEYIGYRFEEYLQKAKKWGLTHLCTYEKREQILVKI